MISGYFLCYSKSVKVDKLLSMVIQVWTYSILGYFVFSVYLQDNSINIRDLFIAFTPLIHKTSWFFSCYILLYIMHPYINLVITNLDLWQFKKLLLIILVLWSFVPSILRIDFYANDFLQFVTFYMIGSYLRLYDPFKKIHHSWSIVLLMALLWLGLNSLLELCGFSSHIKDATLLLADKNSPFILLTAALLCNAFIKSNIKYMGIINEFAGCIGGIYLIHDNPYVRNYLYCNIFSLGNISHPFMLPLLVVFFVTITFLACYLIEKIRKSFYNRVVFLTLRSKE